MSSNATLPSLTPEQLAKCAQGVHVLASLPLGPTIGVAFIGVALSAM